MPIPDLEEIAAGLLRLFPDLSNISPLQFLGEGFRNVAVETASGYVFRIAKSREAAIGHIREANLLPALRGHIPTPILIPAPQWYSGSSDAFSYGLLGYRKLPGVQLDPARLASTHLDSITRDLAAFIMALHSFPVENALSCGLTQAEFSDIDALVSLRDTVMPVVEMKLSAREHITIARWWDNLLQDDSFRTFRPVVHHGDLWYDHILIDSSLSRVVGIFDFESAAIGDPAQDFATLLHLGRLFTGRVIDAYSAAGGVLDAGFSHRLQKLWELREFDGLHTAISTGDAPEIQDAIRKLRTGPVLNP
ncbi:MAG: phosphotransferase [Chloroflexota bacterium]